MAFPSTYLPPADLAPAGTSSQIPTGFPACKCKYVNTGQQGGKEEEGKIARSGPIF